jgi:hypothetical protein
MRYKATKLVRPRAVVALATVPATAAILWSSPAHADEVAYLVNVTVRPGYNFASSQDALAYGYGICDKVAQSRPYADVVDDAKRDFATSDGYQAGYLIGQAVNELCPALIWQLRNTAQR